jgi:uncharacterized protein
MITDINTYLGHWPFRKVENSTAPGLIIIMDKYGIDAAGVSSLNAIFYRDTMQGNLELLEEVGPYRDRFLPFAIINPAYPGWKEDFKQAFEGLGMKGLELYPAYHRYFLHDGASLELLSMAAEKKVPIHLPCAIENIRQRHWMDAERNVSTEEIRKALTLCPNGDFIISNGPSASFAEEFSTIKRSGRILYDFERLDAFTPLFKEFLAKAGADSIVFGSGAPMQYVDTQLVKLQYSGLEKEDMEKVLGGNIRKLIL